MSRLLHGWLWVRRSIGISIGVSVTLAAWNLGMGGVPGSVPSLVLIPAMTMKQVSRDTCFDKTITQHFINFNGVW